MAQYRIAVVCLGNICRSPIGQVVLSDALARAGLADEVEVISAGTGDWHVGNPMDQRAAAVLAAHGYDPSLHRARLFDPAWFDDCDLILAMDEANFDTVTALDQRQGVGSQVAMFRDYDPHATQTDRDVPDPYFGGDDGFDAVLTMVERTSDALVDSLARKGDEA